MWPMAIGPGAKQGEVALARCTVEVVAGRLSGALSRPHFVCCLAKQ